MSAALQLTLAYEAEYFPQILCESGIGSWEGANDYVILRTAVY